jgi:hypothetical protein
MPTPNAPRVLAVVALLAGLALGSAALAQAPAGPAPVVTGGKSAGPKRVGPVILDPMEVDFGVVGPNTTVKAEVKITNTTDRPLKILASVPSCQCTSVDMAGTVIQPKETVPMPMSMKTSASTGEKVAAVRLMFEGVPDPIQVVIKSEVAYSVRATPPFLDLQQQPKSPQGQPEAARPLKGTVKLASSDGKPFSVLGAQGKPPAFVGFDPAKDAPRASYELVYDFSAVPANQVPCYFIVETDRADCPAIDLRIRHENTHIKPAFKIAEFRSSVGQIAPGKSGTFELEVKELKDKKVASVTSKDPAQANVKLLSQKPDGQNVLITCEVTPGAERRGLLYFPVTITLSDGRKTDLWVFGRVG